MTDAERWAERCAENVDHNSPLCAPRMELAGIVRKMKQVYDDLTPDAAPEECWAEVEHMMERLDYHQVPWRL